MADNNLFPIGIDSSDFENKLNKVVNQLDNAINKSDKLNDALDEGFKNSSDSADKLNKSLKETENTIDSTKKKSDNLNASLNKSLKNSSKDSEKFEKELSNVSERLQLINDLGKNFGKNMADAYNELDNEKIKAVVNDLVSALSAEIKLSVGEVDQTELQEYISRIEEAKSVTGGLVEFINYAEAQLSKLNPNSEQYQELSDAIDVAKIAMDEFRASTIDSIQAQDKIETRIRRLKEAMHLMAVEGQKDTEIYRQMADELRTLQKEVQKTEQEMKANLSSTPYLDRMLLGTQGVVGGFATLQATLALVGDESEEYEEVTKRLVATLTLLQGIQANINFLNQIQRGELGKLNVLGKLRISNARKHTTSLIAQAKAMTLVGTATKATTLATNAFRVALTATGIGLIVVALGYLYQNWDKVTKKINEFLPAGAKVSDIFKKIEQVAMGVGKAVVNFISAPLQGVIDLLSGEGLGNAVDNFIGNLNVIKNYNEGHQETIERQTSKHLQELEKQEIEFNKRQAERLKNRYAGNEKKMEEAFVLEQQMRLRQIKLLEDMGEDASEIRKEFEDETDAYQNRMQKRREEELDRQRRDAEKRKREQQRANEEAIRQREKAYQERIQLEKAMREQLAKLIDEIEAIEISNISNKYEREIAEIKSSTKKKIEEINNETALTEEAKQKQTELILLLERQKNEKIQEIEKQRINDSYNLQQEAYEQMLNLMEANESAEIQKIHNDSEKQLEAIRERYENNKELQERLIEMVEASRDKKIKEVSKKYTDLQLNREEERMILSIELSQEYAQKSKNVEIQKQIAILEVQKEYAQKRIDALIEQGANENSIEVMRLKAFMNSLDKEINALSKEGGKFNFFEFLGIGDGLSESEQDAVKNALSTTLQGISEITSFMAKQYDEQIKMRQENINSINEEISALENQRDKELELQEEGFANRVAGMEEELAFLETQKQQEIAMQQEALEEKKKIQKAQIVADSLVQVTNLITSSTEIFKSLSKLGPLGIGLAVTTIATMFGAFAAAKIKAFEAVNQNTETFGEGGIIDGKPHAQGGVKYYSRDGKKIKELEGGEYVIKARQTKKYKDLLDAINSDSLSFDFGNLGEASEVNRTLQMMFTDNGYLESIDKGIRRLNEKEDVLETKTHTIKRRGNTIRRIRK